MIDKEKIKAEIKRQIAELTPTKEKIGIVGCVAVVAVKRYLESILSFIDSLREEPVSESQSEKELAEAYLAVFDKKHPILPTLKGKQLADFKNFLNKCQQEFGLKYFGARPTQAKLFEKMTLLWALWGAEHLQGIGRQDEKEQDILVSEDLEKEIQRQYNVHKNPDNSTVKGCVIMTKGGFEYFAKHFFELGMQVSNKAQKNK